MYYDTQDTHYKRVLNGILEVFNNYKNGIGSIGDLDSVVYWNIDALDTPDQERLDPILDFTYHSQKILYGENCEMIDSNGKLRYVEEDDHRPTALKLIEKYEPLVHEALKVDK